MSSNRASSLERQERLDNRHATRERKALETNIFMIEDEREAGGSAPSPAEVNVATSQSQTAPSISSIHASALQAPRQPANDKTSPVSGDQSHSTDPDTAAQAGGGLRQQGNPVEAQNEAPRHSSVIVSQPSRQPASARALVHDESHIRQLLSDEGIQHVDFEAFRRFLEYEKRQQEGAGPSAALQAINLAINPRMGAPSPRSQGDAQSSLDRVQSDNVITVTSSSSSPSGSSHRGQQATTREIITIDSPNATHAEQRQSVCSDDVPLSQLRRE